MHRCPDPVDVPDGGVPHGHVVGGVGIMAVFEMVKDPVAFCAMVISISPTVRLPTYCTLVAMEASSRSPTGSKPGSHCPPSRCRQHAASQLVLVRETPDRSSKPVMVTSPTVRSPASASVRLRRNSPICVVAHRITSPRSRRCCHRISPTVYRGRSISLPQGMKYPPQ